MNSQTPITYTFLGLCFVVSIPSAFSSSYFELFNSELPHEYWWQMATMPFQHGAKGMPLAVLGHLFLNMILLLFCGRITEKMLGSRRFLLLSIIAWSAYVLVQWVSGVWINGSSGIIWSYSPFLLIVIRWGKASVQYRNKAAQAKLVLVVMWGIITVFMGFVPLLFNPDLHLGYTFFFGNLFHATATFVGFIFYFMWQKSL